jgi:hypothetical protein
LSLSWRQQEQVRAEGGDDGEVRQGGGEECQVNDAPAKEGTLKSGSGRKVTSRKQAIAIALNESREKGAKVPRKRRRKTTRKSTKKSARKK